MPIHRIDDVEAEQGLLIFQQDSSQPLDSKPMQPWAFNSKRTGSIAWAHGHHPVSPVTWHHFSPN